MAHGPRRSAPTYVSSVVFSVGELRFGESRKLTRAVEIAVDGHDLFEVVQAAGRHHAAEGISDEVRTPSPGLPPEIVVPPSRHWLGSPRLEFSEGDRAVIYNCECGDWRCDGVLARVEVADDHVTWSDFSGPRDGRLYPIRPRVFDRRRYESALSALNDL